MYGSGGYKGANVKKVNGKVTVGGDCCIHTHTHTQKKCSKEICQNINSGNLGERKG